MTAYIYLGLSTFFAFLSDRALKVSNFFLRRAGKIINKEYQKLP